MQFSNIHRINSKIEERTMKVSYHGCFLRRRQMSVTRCTARERKYFGYRRIRSNSFMNGCLWFVCRQMYTVRLVTRRICFKMHPIGLQVRHSWGDKDCARILLSAFQHAQWTTCTYSAYFRALIGRPNDIIWYAMVQYAYMIQAFNIFSIFFSIIINPSSSLGHRIVIPHRKA